MKGDLGVSPTEYSGIPLGGIGAGTFEVRADGHFHEWQIMNNKPLANAPATARMDDEGLFFGIAVNDGRNPRVMMLNRPRWSDHDHTMSWESLRWTCEPYHMPWMEYPRRISYEGRFPFAALNYDAPRFPVSATLEAASPFVPLDAKNSA
ncbi:MAG: GH116 family glycosyl-hydrolase, partial [Planctomycetota bacterium]